MGSQLLNKGFCEVREIVGGNLSNPGIIEMRVEEDDEEEVSDGKAYEQPRV